MTPFLLGTQPAALRLGLFRLYGSKGSELLSSLYLRALFIAVDSGDPALVLIDGARSRASLFCLLQDAAVLHLFGKAVQERAHRFTFSTF